MRTRASEFPGACGWGQGRPLRSQNSGLYSPFPHKPLWGPSGEKESECLLVAFDQCLFPPLKSRTTSPVLTLPPLTHSVCVCKDCVNIRISGPPWGRAMEDTQVVTKGGEEEGLDTSSHGMTGSQRTLSIGTGSRQVLHCSPAQRLSRELIENENSESGLPGFKSWFCPLLVVACHSVSIFSPAGGGDITHLDTGLMWLSS